MIKRVWFGRLVKASSSSYYGNLEFFIIRSIQSNAVKKWALTLMANISIIVILRSIP